MPAQELTALYTGPLRQALRASGLNYAFGDTTTGADIDDTAFDQDTQPAAPPAEPRPPAGLCCVLAQHVP